MNYRRRNFQLDPTPPGPVPRTPKIEKITAGDTTATVEWSYPSNEVNVDHWDLELYEGAALLATLRIEGPDTRKHTLGELTNDLTYGVQLQAVNLNGRSDVSNRVDFTPKGASIPKPTVLPTVTGWDGYATFTFTCDNPPAPIDAVHYIAKRTDSGYEFEGVATMTTSRTGTTGPIDNDREYNLYVALEVGGKIGPYSEPSNPFTPTNPVPPFAPIWAHVDATKWDRTSTGGGKGVDWLLTIAAGAKNVQQRADSGPLNITGYRYQIVEKSSGNVIIERSVPSSQSSYSVSDTGPWMDGIAVMTCWAKNKDGESKPTTIEFDIEPHDELPIDFGIWEEFDGYRYHVAEESITNYAKVNKKGVGVKLEWLIVGAGGAGAGRTTLGGKGGDGGSGEVKTGTITPFTTGKITSKLGDGAKYSDTTGGGASNINFLGSDIYSAAGGGQASGKNDGTPSYTTPAKTVESYMPGAEKLRVWRWNTPYSTNLGGAREWDKNTAPDANLYGQAGGGTSGSGSNRGGNGYGGIAVIRYKISDVPKLEPELKGWAAWKARRFERKHAREVRRTRA